MPRRFYVDITGVSQEYLDFLGYPCLYEDDEFKVLTNKGDFHFIDKAKPRLFVDDMNDVNLLRGAFAFRPKMPFPPPSAKSKKSKKPKKGRRKKD